MTQTINNISSADSRDAIHRAVALLAAGEWVGLPADTSYVVAAQALQTESVERLRDRSGGALVLVVRGVDELLDFATDLDREQERLCRRLWPGPLIVEVPVPNPESGLMAGLPEPVRQAIRWESGIRVTVPDNATTRSLQRLTATPLVFAESWEGKILTSAGDITERIGTDVRLVLDAGPVNNEGPCSVVRIDQTPPPAASCQDGEGWKLMRTGVWDESRIRERLPVGIVFVCTGNTCRSPLAASILRKILSQRLGCATDQLTDHGYYISSAGVSAEFGMPAASESLALAEAHGLDLDSHRSQFLTDVLLDRADQVYAMTAAHRAVILARRPDLVDRVELLSREGLDVIDPIGGGPAEYERCRAEIERELMLIVEQLPTDRNGS